MDYGPLSLIHRLLSCAMCLHLSLCAFLRFYGPLFCSMFHYSALWAVVPFYVPSSWSMCRRTNLWTVIHVLWTVFIFLYYINFISDLCAFLRFYGPLFCSMGHDFVLWTFILFYGPLSCSMCHHLVLCAISPPYVPSLPIYGPSATFYVPTTTTTTQKNRTTIALPIVIRSSPPGPRSTAQPSALFQLTQYVSRCVFALFYAIGDADAFK